MSTTRRVGLGTQRLLLRATSRPGGCCVSQGTQQPQLRRRRHVLPPVMHRALEALVHDTSGSTLTEYALMFCLAACATCASIAGITDALRALFEQAVLALANTI